MTYLLDLDLPVTEALFGWRRIGEAPTDGTMVRLWIEPGDRDGYELRRCFWNEDARPADWHHRPEQGRPRVAAPIGQHVSFWREDNDEAVKAPGRSVMSEFDLERPATWLEGMRGRFRSYGQSFADATEPFDLYSDLPRTSTPATIEPSIPLGDRSGERAPVMTKVICAPFQGRALPRDGHEGVATRLALLQPRRVGSVK